METATKKSEAALAKAKKELAKLQPTNQLRLKAEHQTNIPDQTYCITKEPLTKSVTESLNMPPLPGREIVKVLCKSNTREQSYFVRRAGIKANQGQGAALDTIIHEDDLEIITGEEAIEKAHLYYISDGYDT